MTDSPDRKQLIYVSCTSAYTYPERPLYLLVRGHRYEVHEVISHAKIQSVHPPFHNVHRYAVVLEDGRVAELEYREKQDEWYLLNPEVFSEGGEAEDENY